MSMDDQYRHMVSFHRALEEFDNRLMHSMQELEEQHVVIDKLWQDEVRRDYDREWQPLYTRINDYLRRESPAYRQFLEMKLRFLERYLRGG